MFKLSKNRCIEKASDTQWPEAFEDFNGHSIKMRGAFLKSQLSVDLYDLKFYLLPNK